MTRFAVVTHTVVLAVLVICYTVITVTGHDGTALLGVITGYIGGAGVANATKQTGR